MREPSLFDDEEPRPRYPDAAGFKVAGSTSEEAARTIDATAIRLECYNWLKANGPATADQVAEGLDYSILTIRPRMSELHAKNLIRDTGDRGINSHSGKRAIKWEVTP